MGRIRKILCDSEKKKHYGRTCYILLVHFNEMKNFSSLSISLTGIISLVIQPGIGLSDVILIFVWLRIS